MWISSADTKPKPPQEFRNNNTLLEALFIPWFRRASFEQSGSLSYELRCIRSYSPLRESVHSFWSSCKFSLARNMHFMLSLMSKGTWMVRTSVWMLQSMPLNIWCRASDARTQQSELTQSSPVAHTSESVAGQAVRSSGKDRKLCYFRREHFQQDVSCSLDLSQIQFLQLLICHKELQVLVKADILCHLNPNASKQTHE